MEFLVAAMYIFVNIVDCEQMKDDLVKICKEFFIFGGLILSREGLNGTIAGEESNLKKAIFKIKAIPVFEGINNIKYSVTEVNPFVRMVRE